MKVKLWIFFWFLNLSIFLIVGIINFIIDPYQQYRKATLYPIPYKHARELNAGLAKNYDFNSVLIGTSMMQSFSIDDVESIIKFKKPIKLVMAGSSAYEQRIMLNTAIKYKNVENVLIGVDFLSYYGSTNRLKYGESFFPFYLYDDNIFNDYKYLFSFDTLEHSIEYISNKNKDVKNNPLYDFKKMYEWSLKKSDDEALKTVHNKWINRNFFDNNTKNKEKKINLMIENFNYNMLPLIQGHSTTDFILFFPPYSVLAYKVYAQRNQLQDFIEFKKYIVKRLSRYKNVKIYDFQFAHYITNDLSNYRDLSHYKAFINKWMLEQMLTDNYRVDNNIQKINTNEFVKHIKDYDVSIKF